MLKRCLLGATQNQNEALHGILWTPISWDSSHQSALESLIMYLTMPPILAYPDYTKPFVLHTDASEQGLGAVLYQKQDGVMRVISYGSRTLNKAQRNYQRHSRKLEFLALKWAICEHSRDYLYYANSFTVYTDNNPLTHHCQAECYNTSLGCRTC